ncbi:hypothetical protein F4604DRAFT_1923140 [Suillus subluteus]|nr:hypothetical protein F4604DRAFT_1923140 [Suillus subluteus]
MPHEDLNTLAACSGINPILTHLNHSPNTRTAQNSCAKLHDILETLNSLTINDLNDPQAYLIMDLASAKRDVFRAEQLLADCVVWEHEVMASLLKTKVTTPQCNSRQGITGDEPWVDCRTGIVVPLRRVNGSCIYHMHNVTIQLD